MFKRAFPIVLALIVFLIAFILLRPAPSRLVVVAAYDLRAGHVLSDQDVTLRSIPSDGLPTDVITDKTTVIGQPLRIDRGQGDVIRSSQLGNLIELAPNERAVAVKITDPTGMAGLLVPGQKVGVVATIPEQNAQVSGTFSKATIEGLRVLYIDPRFAASMNANVVPQSTPQTFGLTGSLTTQDRATTGTVVVAVPTNLQTIFYDFTSSGAISQSRTVNALELLAALETTDGAEITLYLIPDENANKFTSPGLWLPDLIVTPLPTATPTFLVPPGTPGVRPLVHATPTH